MRERAAAAPVAALFWVALSVTAARACALYAGVCAGRVRYPYDLEWMEGGMVDHVLRLFEGEPLYVKPSLDFAPFLYNPLFYVFGAVSSAVVGVGPFALRLVSVLASLGVGLLLGRIVARHTASAGAGFVAAGLYYATYELSGGWMDIARVDSLFLLLTLAAVDRATSSARFAVAEAAALLAAAFFAKQYALLVGVPIALYLLVRRGPRAALVFSALSGALTGALILTLNLATDGWYWFWTFRVPAAHGVFGSPLLPVVRTTLFEPAPAACLVAVSGGVLLLARSVRAVRRREPRAAAEALLVLGLACVLLCQAWYSYDHPGRYLNCLMPAHLALSLLAGVAVGAPRELRQPVWFAVAAAVSYQLVALGYSPKTWIPNAADRAACERVEHDLRAAGGDLVLGFRGFYGAPGLNAPHAHQMALLDLFASGLDDHERRLRAEARRRFARGPFSRVLLDNTDYVFNPELARSFRKTFEESVDARPGQTRTGPPMRPRIGYERRR